MRWRLQLLLVWVALLLAPFVTTLALGPALAPLVVALGGAEPHLCACGMKPGTCGCPECARLARGDDGVPVQVDTDVLRSCDDHGPGPLAARLPPFLPAALAGVPLSEPVALLPALSHSEPAPHPVGPPPTRPPRSETG